MWKNAKTKLFWWFVGNITGLALAFDIAFARSIDMSKAGVSLWIFVAVGAFIILLQVVPAIILFMTFVGYMAKGMHDKVPVKENNEVAVKVTTK